MAVVLVSYGFYFFFIEEVKHKDKPTWEYGTYYYTDKPITKKNLGEISRINKGIVQIEYYGTRYEFLIRTHNSDIKTLNDNIRKTSYRDGSYKVEHRLKCNRYLEANLGFNINLFLNSN